MHLPSDPLLEWTGERPLFQLELKKCSGQYVGTIRVIPWAIIYVKSGTLGQVSHQCKSLSYVVNTFIKSVENNVPINQQKG